MGNPVVKTVKPPVQPSPWRWQNYHKGHTSKEIKNHKEEEQAQVQEVEDLSRVFNLETTFPKNWTRNLCLHDFKVAVLVIVHNCKGEDQYPIPPIKWVKLRQKRREWLRTPTSSNIVAPCCCKARADFKEGIDNVGNLSRKDKGKGAKEGPEDPTEGYNQDSFLSINVKVLWFVKTTKEAKRK